MTAPKVDPEPLLEYLQDETKRTIFDFVRWGTHRNTRRYARHVSGLWRSGIIRSLRSPLLFVFFSSLSLVLYHTAKDRGWISRSFPTLSLSSTQPFTLSSLALSLLLVFRTNASYARFDEARTILGAILCRTRHLTRQGLAWIDPEDADLIALLERWTIAFTYALAVHLRPDGDVRKELQSVLLPSEIVALEEAEHKPSFVLSVLQHILPQAGLSDYLQGCMNESLAQLETSLGSCERIFNTPIPLMYTRHTSRFLMLWIGIIPFMMWEACGFASLVLSPAIAFFLLGIEEIGVQIEEPFSILPITYIASVAERNIREMVKKRELTRGIVERGRKGGSWKGDSGGPLEGLANGCSTVSGQQSNGHFEGA